MTENICLNYTTKLLIDSFRFSLSNYFIYIYKFKYTIKILINEKYYS